MLIFTWIQAANYVLVCDDRLVEVLPVFYRGTIKQ